MNQPQKNQRMTKRPSIPLCIERWAVRSLEQTSSSNQNRKTGSRLKKMNLRGSRSWKDYNRKRRLRRQLRRRLVFSVKQTLPSASSLKDKKSKSVSNNKDK